MSLEHTLGQGVSHNGIGLGGIDRIGCGKYLRTVSYKVKFSQLGRKAALGRLDEHSVVPFAAADNLQAGLAKTFEICGRQWQISGVYGQTLFGSTMQSLGG